MLIMCSPVERVWQLRELHVDRGPHGGDPGPTVDCRLLVCQTCTPRAHVTHVCRQLISAATDKLAMVWDAVSGARVRRMRGHTKLINTVAATRNGDTLMATGSDDGNIKVHM